MRAERAGARVRGVQGVQQMKGRYKGAWAMRDERGVMVQGVKGQVQGVKEV